MNIKMSKNRIKASGILFLFVSCLICSSCDKDDDDIQPIRLQYATDNDKPNPVTNNQVALDFPSEKKTGRIRLC